MEEILKETLLEIYEIAESYLREIEFNEGLRLILETRTDLIQKTKNLLEATKL